MAQAFRKHNCVLAFLSMNKEMANSLATSAAAACGWVDHSASGFTTWPKKSTALLLSSTMANKKGRSATKSTGGMALKDLKVLLGVDQWIILSLLGDLVMYLAMAWRDAPLVSE